MLKSSFRAGDVDHWLTAFVALAEEPGQILAPATTTSGDLAPFSNLFRVPNIHLEHIHSSRQNTPTRKK